MPALPRPGNLSLPLSCRGCRGSNVAYRLRFVDVNALAPLMNASDQIAVFGFECYGQWYGLLQGEDCTGLAGVLLQTASQCPDDLRMSEACMKNRTSSLLKPPRRVASLASILFEEPGPTDEQQEAVCKLWRCECRL